ncbi:MAG: hypothetical protein OEZ68_18355 [Gammaproteobacteria bacterium]|nr:hypothetical protein [Gammaproteobacteria bacterium]MDH5802769.1 hypothetical protein [Gammaproteobacteria bacterium]
MSRYSDTLAHRRVKHFPLPPVDWNRIDAEAPRVLGFDYHGPNSRLPKADAVVITWTSAEWSALDHVMINSDSYRNPTAEHWRDAWLHYAYDAPVDNNDNFTGNPLWGFIRLVEINAKKVLLLKSDAHLAHPPYAAGLSHLIQLLIEQAQPSEIFSIGTAGGSELEEKLADVVITNAAVMNARLKNNQVPYNHETISNSWNVPEQFLQTVRENLFYDINEILTTQQLQTLCQKLNHKLQSSYPLEQLVNAALRPPLPLSKIRLCKDKPLLTTDFYYIAPESGDPKYSTLEMDDAVIAYECKSKNVHFTFIRNISDPLVTGGLPDHVRDDWSSLIYEAFGLYSSFNGALACWAVLAGR